MKDWGFLSTSQGRSGRCKNCVTCVSQNGDFRKKNLSQVCHKILAILSGWFALTQVIPKQQVVVKLWPGREMNCLLMIAINWHCSLEELVPIPKILKCCCLWPGWQRTLVIFHLLHLLFAAEITTESLELRIELLLFKKTPCWADFAIIGFVWQFWIFATAVCFWWKTFLEARACVLIGQWTKKKRA